MGIKMVRYRQVQLIKPTWLTDLEQVYKRIGFLQVCYHNASIFSGVKVPENSAQGQTVQHSEKLQKPKTHVSESASLS